MSHTHTHTHLFSARQFVHNALATKNTHLTDMLDGEKKKLGHSLGDSEMSSARELGKFVFGLI